MCAICGCEGDEHEHGHEHEHEHEHVHVHEPVHQRVRVEADLLEKNRRIAEDNRGWLADRRVLAINLLSAPGAGKTTLLERALRELSRSITVQVIEGDQATSRDAERIRATGARCVQINTGTGCHLDALMVQRALGELDPPPGALVFIENVGNLVCPALFDLGEHSKVVLFSVTEGEDKPLKYPHIFRASDRMLLTKTDLLPYVRFDSERAIANALEVNPRLRVMAVSSETGAGFADLYGFIRSVSETVHAHG